MVQATSGGEKKNNSRIMGTRQVTELLDLNKTLSACGQIVARELIPFPVKNLSIGPN